MNREKLSKIFEIYRDLNRDEKLEINTTFDELKPGKLKLLPKPKVLKLIITPNDFTIKGNLDHLNRDNITKLLEQAKTHVDKEYDALKALLSSLKNKL